MKLSKLIITGITAIALGTAACAKKEEKKEEAPAAAAAAPATDPAAAAPEAAKPADPAVAAAAAPAAPGTSPLSAEETKLADDMVAMFESIAKTAEANKGNCDAMGAELQKIVDSSKELMQKAKVMDQDEAKKKWLEETYTPKLMPLMGGMMGAMEGCMSNPAVQKAMEGLAAE